MAETNEEALVALLTAVQLGGPPETIRRLRAAVLARMCGPGEVVVQGWQPIETAPRNGDSIDLGGFTKRGDWRRVPDCYWHKKARQWVTPHRDRDGYDGLRPPFEPTHWIKRASPPARPNQGGNDDAAA